MTLTFDTAPILTYHSISHEPGPTSISPEIFQTQIEAIKNFGVEVVGLGEIKSWISGEREFTRRTIAITFDDAFLDYKEVAFPILNKCGIPSTVFVPTSLVGGKENWKAANKKPRPLMSWEDIEELSKSGVDFGSHSRWHHDLTLLGEAALEEELAESRRALEEKLGMPVRHFAPPYGRNNELVRKIAARHYSLSVGVSLGEARRTSPIQDLPRIEMYYYRDFNQWRAFLEGKGSLYMQMRRAARCLRESFNTTGHVKRVKV